MNNLNKYYKLLDEPLHMLTGFHKFPTRAYDVCKQYELNTLSHVLNYFINHRSFLTLEGVDNITNIELSSYCVKVLENPTIHSSFFNKFEIIKYISDSLSPNQHKTIDLIIVRKVNKLSPRAKNALNTHFNRHFKNNINFKSLNRAFSKRLNIIKLENIGRKTAQEVAAFYDALEAIALELLEIVDTENSSSLLLEKLIFAFDLEKTDIEPYNAHFEKGNFPLFHFLYGLSNQNKLLDKQHTAILKHRFGFFTNTEILKFGEIGEKFNLSGERMRQISMQTNIKLTEKLMPLHDMKPEISPFLNYPIDFSQDVFLISLSFSESINERENCFVTPKFIATVFAHLHFDLYSIAPPDIPFLKNIYLFKRVLIAEFNFVAFFNAFNKQIKQSINGDYSCPFNTYLTPFFFKKPSPKSLSRVRNVCEKLIIEEYTEGYEFNASGNIIFKRNTVMQLTEFVENILLKQGKPMKLEDILTILIKNHPQFANKNIEAFRTQLAIKKDIFIFFGRTSTYGLLKWETEREGVKGGTIRDMILEFLEKFEEPKHVFDILQHVVQYRPDTNFNSIDRSLQQKTDIFKYFGCSFWGLMDKNYGEFTFNKTPCLFNSEHS